MNPHYHEPYQQPYPVNQGRQSAGHMGTALRQQQPAAPRQLSHNQPDPRRQSSAGGPRPRQPQASQPQQTLQQQANRTSHRGASTSEVGDYFFAVSLLLFGMLIGGTIVAIFWSVTG